MAKSKRRGRGRGERRRGKERGNVFLASQTKKVASRPEVRRGENEEILRERLGDRGSRPAKWRGGARIGGGNEEEPSRGPEINSCFQTEKQLGRRGVGEGKHREEDNKNGISGWRSDMMLSGLQSGAGGRGGKERGAKQTSVVRGEARQ